MTINLIRCTNQSWNDILIFVILSWKLIETPKNATLTSQKSLLKALSNTTKQVLRAGVYFIYRPSEKTCSVLLQEIVFVWAFDHAMSASKEFVSMRVKTEENDVASRNSSQKTGNQLDVAHIKQCHASFDFFLLIPMKVAPIGLTTSNNTCCNM